MLETTFCTRIHRCDDFVSGRHTKWVSLQKIIKFKNNLLISVEGYEDFTNNM